MEFLDKAWDDIKHLFANVADDIAVGLGALVQSIATSGGPLLMALAQDAVIAAEAQGGAGDVKFAAAKDAVVAGLTARGAPIVMNAIHGAIEAMVANQKALSAQGDINAPAADPAPAVFDPNVHTDPAAA